MASIIYTKQAPIAIISLNRPHVLNAMNEEMAEAFFAALRDFNGDPAMRVAILKGEGRGFSGGHDVKEVRPKDKYGGELGGLGGAHKILEPFSLKPLVGAIHGWCVGHGVDWALHCDVLVASEGARFSLPEARIGVCAGYVWDNIPHIAPAGDGFKMLLTGEPISAQDAYRLGLVQKVVPEDRLMEEACSVAASLAEMDSQTAMNIKRVAYLWRNVMLEECGRVGFTFVEAMRPRREPQRS